MAQTPATWDDYVGDGVEDTYQVTFPYQKEQEVFAYVDEVLASFTFISAGWIQFDVIPPDQSAIRIIRSTEAFEPRHEFENGVPLLPRFIDENNKQFLYVAQEAINETAGTAAEALAVAAEARDIAQEAEDKVDGAIFDSAFQLRLDLLNQADPTKGGAIVARSLRQVYSWADLGTTAPLFDGDQVYLTGYYTTGVGIGDGIVTWDAASTATPDGGTVQAVAGIPTGRWVRKLGTAVFLEWFGILGDGVTPEDAKLRAAAAATPQGGTLFMPTREMTVLLDIPSGQSSRWQSAVNFDKPGVRVLGSHSCTFKLKDFTSAYTSYVGVSGLAAFRASASSIEVKGLNIDANADHHYETDGGGFKWFEGEGPTGKRPPSGIMVTIEDGADKITGVRIRGNKIYRPLAGVYVAGNLSIAAGTSLDDPTFFTGALATDIIEDCEVSGNEVSFARGNDYIFITGVRDSAIRGNKSINSMYHNARFYAGVESCVMEDNRAYMNYAEIAARWNETDLGYWRSNNPAEVGGYLLERAGFAIGSTAAQTSNNSGNVRRCSMINNKIWYNSNTEDGGIVDTAQGTLGSFFVWQVVNGILVSGNESHNSPFNGLVYTNSILALNPVAQGVVFKDNRINNSRFEFIFTLGTGPVFVGNVGTNCTINGNGKGVIFCQGGAKIYKNDLIWQRTTANTNDIIKFVTYGTVGLPFISDNEVFGYTGTRINKLSTDIVHGTDGGGVPITLLAGWTAGSEAALITVNCSGYVQLHGRINSAAGGTDTFATLNGILTMYRPPASVRYPTWQDSGTPGVVLGNATPLGNLAAVRGALAVGTPFDISANWRVDLRLPV